MFRQTVLAILSAAVFSAAAQAASPCHHTPGEPQCHKTAVTAAGRGAFHASKQTRPAAHNASRQAGPSKSDYASAEAMLTRALAERKSKLGEEHPFTLTTANSLAVIYKAQGRYKEAEALYHRSMEASERAFGNGHPLTKAAIKGLAAVYKAEGRHAEASLLWRRTGLGDPAQFSY